MHGGKRSSSLVSVGWYFPCKFMTAHYSTVLNVRGFHTNSTCNKQTSKRSGICSSVFCLLVPFCCPFLPPCRTSQAACYCQACHSLPRVEAKTLTSHQTAA
jgi:hypothetical protein